MDNYKVYLAFNKALLKLGLTQAGGGDVNVDGNNGIATEYTWTDGKETYAVKIVVVN